ncbi:PLDc N-terminal domain-containing protein [Sphingobacterium sp. N143]|uniref:PLDc N-terminal domain-containing protein n=1 Tax=Sphingobacterium sp. N143 TaxID=2746727 RepID=UPI0025780AA6|nr:PLDc N-terminal domain-containing protein [Sphingobacterium sp. N143]MDM1296035.1 PLDc N-terminal domain-containing protein [Sphingobacterium sp. N143]
MKNLEHQTKQAFLFSLAFYIVAILARFFNLGIFPILGSLSILLSLLWVILALREIMLSRTIANGERILMALAIVLFNIIGGIFYFFVWRQRVLGLMKK